jgi:hypothetical protein
VAVPDAVAPSFLSVVSLTVTTFPAFRELRRRLAALQH